jgi:LysR family transcriptional regulator, carnitine catabolism transcriptional activator
MIENLHHVKAFLVAARIGNFTRAAQELHLSQSAFTVQIRQLEEALGITLFDRGKRGAFLTTAGQELLVPLERLLIDAESITSHTRALSDLSRGLVIMSVLPSIAACILPEIIGRFAQQYPGVVVKVHDAVAEKLIEEVKNGTADFGIGTPMQADHTLTYKSLMTDRLCAFMPSDHPLANCGVLTLKRLTQFPLLVTGKDSSVREVFEHALGKAQLIPTIAYETNYMATGISMAKANLGIAVLPESAAKINNDPTLCSIPIGKPPLNRKIVLVQRRERSLSPAAGKMVEAISQKLTSRSRIFPAK